MTKLTNLNKLNAYGLCMQKKYLIADEGKEWKFETLNGQWKAWKYKCKALYYFPYKNYDERWEKRPRTIPENIFQQLLSYWDDETIKVCLTIEYLYDIILVQRN